MGQRGPWRRSSLELLLVLWLCLFPLARAVGETPGIQCDLQTCIDLALANHPTLKVGTARESAAQAFMEVRKAERQPALRLEGAVGHLSGQGISPFTVINDVTEEGAAQRDKAGGYYNAIVGLEVPILREGALIGLPSSAVRQAQFGVTEAAWENQGLRLQVALVVAEAYVRVLKHRKAIQTYAKIVAFLEADYQLAQAQFAQNLLSRNDLLIAEVQLATAGKDLAFSQLALRRSQKALALAMGLPGVSEVDVQELPDAPAPLPPMEQSVPLVRENHPLVQAQQLKVRISAEELKRVRSERYPSLSMRMHYGFADDFTGAIADQWDVALKINVPLFDFGLIGKKAVVAHAKVVEEEERLQEFKLNIVQEIYNTYSHIQEFEEQIKLIEKQIEQSIEALKLNTAMFRQELLPQTEVNNAEKELLKLQLAQAEAEYDRSLSKLQLRMLLEKSGVKN